MRRWLRFRWRTLPSTLSKAARYSAAAFMLASAMLSASSGCDSGSFIPPPLDDLKGRDAAAEPATDPASATAAWEPEPAAAKTVELILDRRDLEEEGLVTAAARKQGGLDKVRLNIAALGEKDPPQRQVELVREALARKPLALVVEPSAAPDRQLAEVVDKARVSGVPVVLLNGPLTDEQQAAPNDSESNAGGTRPTQPKDGQFTATTPIPGSRKPMVLIKPPSFTSSAQQLVASAIRRAKSADLEPQEGAIIMINTIGDPLIHTRALAIRNVLESIGIREDPRDLVFEAVRGRLETLDRGLRPTPSSRWCSRSTP